MDWVHCNACFGQPANTSRDREYYLTNCGHIFCYSCGYFLNESLQNCQVCGQSCSSIKLNTETNPEILQYFDEPENIVKRLLKTIKFQKSQQVKLFKHQRYMLQKNIRTEEYAKKLENKLKIEQNLI